MKLSVLHSGVIELVEKLLQTVDRNDQNFPKIFEETYRCVINRDDAPGTVTFLEGKTLTYLRIKYGII